MATISVTFSIPGTNLYTEKECQENPKLYTHNSVKINTEGREETISFLTRKAKPVKQTVQMNESAYRYMTGKSPIYAEDAKNCPEWSKPQFWFNLSKEDRLKMHLARMCRDLSGIFFEYQIFED